MRVAMRAAGALQSAARNEHNWNFAVNGESRTLEQAVRDHDGVVFDVGSNIGQWATQALSRIEGRELHCFEAAPEPFRALQTAVGNREDVYLNNYALGARPGEIEFNYCAGNPEISSRYFPRHYGAGASEPIIVPVTTGDAYCTEREIDQIAMLKIDVEGMECEVLAGFASILGAHRIGIIQFEYGFGWVGARRYLKDACDLLAGVGYRVFRQYPDGDDLLAYTEADEDFRPRNFIAKLT